MRPTRQVSWRERGAIQLGVILGLGGLIVTGAGVGVGVQRAVLASDDGGSSVSGMVTTRAAVPVFDCPGGAAVGELHNGDRIFANAVHDELDGWLEIRHPNDPGRGFWIEQRFVTPDESTGDLDPVPCTETEVFYGEPPTTTTSSSTTTTTTRPGQEPADDPDDPGDSDEPSQPGQTTTTQPSSGGGGSSDTTTTTKPSGGGGSPGTTTTTAGDVTGPTIGSPSGSPNTIAERWNDGSNYSCSQPTTSTIDVIITDSSGVASATLSWSVGNSSGSKSMSHQGDNWFATIGPFNQNTVDSNTGISITITATDGEGNTASRPPSTPVTLNNCTVI